MRGGTTEFHAVEPTFRFLPLGCWRSSTTSRGEGARLGRTAVRRYRPSTGAGVDWSRRSEWDSAGCATPSVLADARWKVIDPTPCGSRTRLTLVLSVRLGCHVLGAWPSFGE